MDGPLRMGPTFGMQLRQAQAFFWYSSIELTLNLKTFCHLRPSDLQPLMLIRDPEIQGFAAIYYVCKP